MFGLLIGLAIAVVLSLLALVYRAYRPSYAVLGRAPGAVDDERLRYRGIEDHPDAQTFPGLVILRIDGELFFANARWFRDTVRSLVHDQTPPVRELLVHAGAVPHLDTTAAAMLKELIGELRDDGVELAFAGSRPASSTTWSATASSSSSATTGSSTPSPPASTTSCTARSLDWADATRGAEADAPDGAIITRGPRRGPSTRVRTRAYGG